MKSDEKRPLAWRQDLKNQAKRWEGWRFSKNAHFRAVDQQVEKKYPKKLTKRPQNETQCALKPTPKTHQKNDRKNVESDPPKGVQKADFISGLGALGRSWGIFGAAASFLTAKMWPKSSKTDPMCAQSVQKRPQNYT